MKKFTVDDVLKLGPCEPYTRKYLEKLFAGRKALTLKDVVEMVEVPAEDIILLAVRIFTRRECIIFSLKCVEAAGILAWNAPSELTLGSAAWADWAAWEARLKEATVWVNSLLGMDVSATVEDGAEAIERQLLFVCETILETEASYGQIW